MPSGNDSGSPTDYRISDPPPATQQVAYNLIQAGGASAFVGASLSLLGCLYLHQPVLVWAGFFLSLVGVGLVFGGLSKLRPNRVPDARKGNPHGGSHQVRQIALASVGQTLPAADSCPTPLLGTLYHLEANEHSECPKSWPVGQEVTFYRSSDGQALVSAILLHESCDVVLTEPQNLRQDGTSGTTGYGIAVTPL